MSLSKRAFGVRGFEAYEDNDYICIVHGFEDRDGKHGDNSLEIIVDGKKEKVCPHCFRHKLNNSGSEIDYWEFTKDGENFIPVEKRNHV